MLLRFAFSNFLSVRDRQELVLTASGLRDEPDFTLRLPGQNTRAVPIAGIYGANASGKTNVLMALRYLTQTVLTSHTHREPGAGIRTQPFALDEQSARNPSRFEVDFVVEGTRYHFGFEESEEAIVEEWLFAYPRGRKQEWYSRSSSEKGVGFGSSLGGRNRVIEELMRPNSLFLSTAAQNNHDQILPIYKFFRESFLFRLDTREDLLDPRRLSIVLSGETQSQYLRFLSHADVGISDFKVEDFEISKDINEFMTDFGSLVKKRYPDAPDVFTLPSSLKRLTLGHNTPSGNTVYFDIDSESRGTLELLALLGPVFDALQSGKTLVVDEIDTSLHPFLSKKILEMFASPETNTHSGQLIFTTHDTNLLSCGVLRRDEVWFTEKDKHGATSLYPLTDIKTRRTDNLQRGYMQGRFGAVPYLGDIKALLEEPKTEQDTP